MIEWRMIRYGSYAFHFGREFTNRKLNEGSQARDQKEIDG
jgi:hypothetical protein